MAATPIGNRQVVGYGVGDFSMNLYWSGTAFFLLYWYTDVAGVPNEVAGLLFFIGLVWDAVTDPGMGIVAERTRTRWGRYRPCILLGSIPLAASFVLLLWVPPFEGVALTGALSFIMTMILLGLICAAALLIRRYPIDLALHERIVNELEATT